MGISVFPNIDSNSQTIINLKFTQEQPHINVTRYTDHGTLPVIILHQPSRGPMVWGQGQVAHGLGAGSGDSWSGIGSIEGGIRSGGL